MPKLKYRLQAVQDMRQRAKDKAAEFVAVRRQELAEAEAELARRKKAVLECKEKQELQSEKMMVELMQGVAANKIVAHRGFLDLLKEEELNLRKKVDEQEIAVEKAEQNVESAMQALIEATKELKVIETHREKWETETRKEFEKKEQKMNDEIGATLYQRRLKQLQK
jgi:flagellar export protein FliJ